MIYLLGWGVKTSSNPSFSFNFTSTLTLTFTLAQELQNAYIWDDKNLPDEQIHNCLWCIMVCKVFIPLNCNITKKTLHQTLIVLVNYSHQCELCNKNKPPQCVCRVAGSSKWGCSQDAEKCNTDDIYDDNWTTTSLVCNCSTNQITNKKTCHEERLNQISLVRITAYQTPLQKHTAICSV